MLPKAPGCTAELLEQLLSEHRIGRVNAYLVDRVGSMNEHDGRLSRASTSPNCRAERGLASHAKFPRATWQGQNGNASLILACQDGPVPHARLFRRAASVFVGAHSTQTVSVPDRGATISPR